MPERMRWRYLTREQVLDILADEAPESSAPALEQAAFMLACARLATDQEDRVLLVTLAAASTAAVNGDPVAVTASAERLVPTLRDALALADLMEGAKRGPLQ